VRFASASGGGFCRFCFPQRNDKIIASHTQSLCASHSETATVCREVELRVRACRFRIPNAGVAELADALDSKSRNHGFYLITCDEMPFTIFIGKFGVYRRIDGIREG
jgi:hypothetical protein